MEIILGLTGLNLCSITNITVKAVAECDVGKETVEAVLTMLEEKE